MANTVIIAFRYQSDGKVTSLTFSLEDSLEVVRRRWAEAMQLDESAHKFRLMSGEAVPAKGAVSDLCKAEEFVIPLVVVPVLRVCRVSLLQMPSLSTSLALDSDVNPEEVISRACTELGVEGGSMRVLMNDEVLTPGVSLDRQVSSPACQLVLDMEFQLTIDVLTAAEFEEPECDEDGEVKTDDSGVVPCRCRVRPQRHETWFGSSPVSALFVEGVPESEQRLWCGHRRIRPRDLVIDIFKGGDGVTARSAELCLELSFPVYVQRRRGQAPVLREETVWPRQTVAELRRAPDESVFWEGAELDPGVALHSLRLQRMALLQVSSPLSLAVKDEGGGSRAVRVASDASVFELRQALAAAGSDFLLVCGGLRLDVDDPRTLRQLGLQNLSAVRVEGRRKEVDAVLEGRYRCLGPLRLGLPVEELLAKVGAAFGVALPPDTALVCACGIEVSRERVLRLPALCCDAERRVLDVRRPVEVEVRLGGVTATRRLPATALVSEVVAQVAEEVGRDLTAAIVTVDGWRVKDHVAVHQVASGDRVQMRLEEAEKGFPKSGVAPGQTEALVGTEESSVENFAAEKRTLEADKEKMKRELRELQLMILNDLKALNDRITQLEKDIDRIEKDRRRLQSQRDILNKRVNELEREGGVSKNFLAEKLALEEDKKKMEGELLQLQLEKNALNERIKALEKINEINEKERRQLQSQRDNLNNELRKGEKGLGKDGSVVKNFIAEKRALKKEKKKVEEELQELQSEKEALNDRVKTWEKKYECTEKVRRQLQSQRDNLNNELTKLEKEKNSVTKPTVATSWPAYSVDDMKTKNDFPPAEFFIYFFDGDDFFLTVPRKSAEISVGELRAALIAKSDVFNGARLYQWKGWSRNGEALFQILDYIDRENERIYAYATASGELHEDEDVKTRRKDLLEINDELLVMPEYKKCWIDVRL